MLGLISAMLMQAAAPPAVEAAVQRAVAVTGARALVTSYEGTSCEPERAEVPREIRTSGRVAVRITGAACRGTAWAQVQVMGQIWVTRRAVRVGEPLDGATTLALRELAPGHAVVSELPAGAKAAIPLAQGAALQPGWIQGPGPQPGDAVTVSIHAGEIEIEQAGHAVPCAAGRACAQLISGRRVEGSWRGDRIEVDVP